MDSPVFLDMLIRRLDPPSGNSLVQGGEENFLGEPPAFPIFFYTLIFWDFVSEIFHPSSLSSSLVTESFLNCIPEV
jgi:hypothetical protein